MSVVLLAQCAAPQAELAPQLKKDSRDPPDIVRCRITFKSSSDPLQAALSRAPSQAIKVKPGVLAAMRVRLPMTEQTMTLP
ncbi:MAG: hypothetical protein NTZ14_02235 [Hyphomicrobiales bacterium]|nr:hypothetical protein [Hyphomicrobiales bacterium]